MSEAGDDELDPDDELDLEGGAQTVVTIEISGLSLYTHIGVGAAEREVGQRLLFDIRIDVGESDATETDRIEDTIDYGEVCQLVALIAQQRSYKTLERLCTVVADRDHRGLRRRGRLGQGGQARAADPAGGRGGLGRGLARAARVSATRVGYLGLGSNIGERRANLQAAVDGLAARGAQRARELEHLRHRPGRRDPRPAELPERVPSDRDGARAARAARALQGARARARPRRRRSPSRPARRSTSTYWRSGTCSSRSEQLSLPHEQMLSRRFVLIPLLELDFELCTPGGERLSDALAALDFDEGVRRAGPRLALARIIRLCSWSSTSATRRRTSAPSPTA